MLNPFEIIKGLFKKSEESILGIDVGSSSVKVVQLRKKVGQAVLETYGELSLGPYAGVEVGRATHLAVDKQAEAMKDILREANTTSKKCGIAIPISSSLVSLIELPAVEPKQLSQMIPIEARKYIPVPITEVTLDWWVIPSGDPRSALDGSSRFLGQPQINPDSSLAKTKMEVLVVAIHNEAVAKYQDLTLRSGLEASFFEIEVFSVMRSVLREDNATAMIFDMGASSTKLYVVDRGIIRASHIVNRGSQDITLAISRALNISPAEAETLKRDSGFGLNHGGVDVKETIVATLNFVFAEANKTLLNFEKKYGRAIQNVVLTGGGVNLKGFFEMARSSLESSVSVADPFSRLQAPAFLDPMLRSAGPEFSVAIGAALRRLEETS